MGTAGTQHWGRPVPSPRSSPCFVSIPVSQPGRHKEPLTWEEKYASPRRENPPQRPEVSFWQQGIKNSCCGSKSETALLL